MRPSSRTPAGFEAATLSPGSGMAPELLSDMEKNISALPFSPTTCFPNYQTLNIARKLRELRLDGNQLSRLPDCVTELRGLEVLDLRGNSIEALPPNLKYLRALLDLDLDGNPIGPEVCDSKPHEPVTPAVEKGRTT